jgi:hypothetical protein
MIIILRGHIRTSFNNTILYNFIKNTCEQYRDIEIYIHTWNIFQNNLSWRKLQNNNNLVTVKLIENYFHDIKHLIKKIIIDDDKKIQLNGNLNGLINGSLSPIKGWKNYWYGQYKIIQHIYDSSNNKNILNIRFDLFYNPHAFSYSTVNNFIKKYINHSLKEIVFINNKIFLGCDNCYIGNTLDMYKLIHHFHYNLDSILEEIGEIKHQETLVMIENSKIFNSTNKFTKEDVLDYINKINNKNQVLSNHKFINYALNKVV